MPDVALPVLPSVSVLRPVGIDSTDLDREGFWGSRVQRNADATLEHCLGWLERAGWLGNLDLVAAGSIAGGRRGREFSDSEIYKLLEAYCWEAAAHPDPERDGVIDAVSRRIAAAQEADGYLGTAFGHDGQPARWSDLEWGHELYCIGHLLQAAVARLRTHGDDLLVQVARRAADLVCSVFGRDGREAVCGHPEIELGLVELGRATGERRYIEQAALFVDRRGRGLLADGAWGRSYYQDDVPVRETEAFHGHAVRALYLAAAAVDVAVETDDRELLDALERQWTRTVAARTYVTGGMGSHHQDESFGEDFELPSDRAYCESCAGVASVMLSWRLLLATGRPRYADLIERTLFNIVATAVGEDGRSFFYSNTLHRRVPGEQADPEVQSPRADSSQRAAWFDVACCPNNLARTFASLTGYLATVDDGGVQLHQYAAGRYAFALPDGEVRLTVRTAYPADGRIEVVVDAAPDRPWALTVRVPGWATGATVADGKGTRRVEPGTTALHPRLGETIVLDLPITVRRTRADARIDAVRGASAVEVGPVVHCLERIALPAGASVEDFVLDDAVQGADAVTAIGRIVRPSGADWPYPGAEGPAMQGEPVVAALTPYHAWGNRGPTAMRIWLRDPEPRTEERP